LARTDADRVIVIISLPAFMQVKELIAANLVEPVSGFEPLTVRLQGGCSAKLSYTGRLVRVASDAAPLQGYRFGRVSANKLPPPWKRARRASRR
jgi:hypothetical protein